jgi:hypothetical protein
MDIHVVTYDCGDYYCEGSHIFGVFDSDRLAKASIDMAPEYWASKGVVGTNHYEYSVGTWELNTIGA